ncbi:unnamed protein product, partial [Mesorhabditis belari]|uniref:Uncharacterized protein n=1 Tax=Mesorhabditis belari TaxID=2138241 RepID=A0AAF3E7M4_9BILA
MIQAQEKVREPSNQAQTPYVDDEVPSGNSRCQEKGCKKIFKKSSPQSLFNHAIGHSRMRYYCQKCGTRAQRKKTGCRHVRSTDCIEKSMVEAWLEKANSCFPDMSEAFQKLVKGKYRQYLQEDEPGCSRDEEVEHGGVNDGEVAQDDLFTKVIKDEIMDQLDVSEKENGDERVEMRTEMVKDLLIAESCSSASNANDDQALSSPASEQNNTKIAQEIDELKKLREELDAKNQGIAEKKKEKAEREKERKPLLMLNPNAISKDRKIDELKMLEAANTENLNIQEERRAPEAPEAHLAGAPEAYLAGAPEAHLAGALEAHLAGALEAHLALQQELAKEAEASTPNLSFVKQELIDSDEMISLWKQLLEADPTAKNSMTILQQKEQELKDQALALGYMMIDLFNLREKNTEPKK